VQQHNEDRDERHRRDGNKGEDVPSCPSLNLVGIFLDSSSLDTNSLATECLPLLPPVMQTQDPVVLNLLTCFRRDKVGLSYDL
jgi:hypothetical protein